MAQEIRQARIVVSAGGGPEYDVTPGNPDTSHFDIGDRFLPAVPSTWQCVAAWLHVSDAIEALPHFHHIDVAPKQDDPSDVDLTVKAWSAGQIQIAVTAVYEHENE